MSSQTIFVNEMPGSGLFLFHVIGSRTSDVLSKTEAVIRGINEIRRGNKVSGPAGILKEIQSKGKVALELDVVST